MGNMIPFPGTRWVRNNTDIVFEVESIFLGKQGGHVVISSNDKLYVDSIMIDNFMD